MRNMNGNKDVTKEMSQAYIAAAAEETPDLWSRIEKGFEDELAGMQSGKAAAPRRVIHWKRYAGIAAAVLICVLVIPLVMGNGEKSDDTVSYDKLFDAEEQYVEGEGSLQNDMGAQADFDYSMNDAEAPVEYFDESAAEESGEGSTKAPAEQMTAATMEDIDIISIIGYCLRVKN